MPSPLIKVLCGLPKFLAEWAIGILMVRNQFSDVSSEITMPSEDIHQLGIKEYGRNTRPTERG